MKVAFVGIGRLGAHLAGSLLRDGVELTVHDRDHAAGAALRERGVGWADTPAEAARDADVVITCLPSPSAVAVVVERDDGMLSSLRRGSTWIDMSTNDKHELLRLAAVAQANGVSTLEAPVTGGVHLAASGEITIIVGGDPDVAGSHMPLLRAMGRRIFHVGPLGSASDMKVITNMLALVAGADCRDRICQALSPTARNAPSATNSPNCTMRHRCRPSPAFTGEPGRDAGRLARLRALVQRKRRFTLEMSIVDRGLTNEREAVRRNPT